MARCLCLKPILSDPGVGLGLCQRPTGHRGGCGYSELPTPPLRPIRVDGVRVTIVPDNSKHIFTAIGNRWNEAG